jgi:hypothetical protein
MKVMCVAIIVQGYTPPHMVGKKFTPPQVGDICTVIETRRSGNLLFYTLAEHDFFNEFDSRAFATLPGLTAEEMSEETRESIINIETPVL